MRPDPRLGTFDEVAAAAPDHAETLAAVRALIEDVHPDAIEAASRKEHSVWWGWGPAKTHEGYAYVIPHRDHVILGFFQGATLADPGQILEGTGTSLRHVKLRGPEDASRPEVRALVEAAWEERRAALGR